MLSGQNNSDALLGKKNSSGVASNSQITVCDKIDLNEERKSTNKSSAPIKTSKKDNEAFFTNILKVFNIVLGVLQMGFGVYCYYGFTSEQKKQNLNFVGYILPGYIAFSGLIILCI